MESVKSKGLLVTLLFLFIFGIVGCSDENLTPITLTNQEGTTINLTPEEEYNLYLQGGDGSYSVQSSNDKIVIAEMISHVELRLMAIGTGETTVIITDNSQNILILNVQIDYRTLNFVVTECYVTIRGDDLTENEKNAIREKQLAQIPVKVGGGYKFIFTEVANQKGKAIIYTDTFDSNGIETTFEFKAAINQGESGSIPPAFEVIIDNEKRVFFLDSSGNYSQSNQMITQRALRESPPPRIFALQEVVTPKVQIEYPKAEFVFTSQVVIP